MQSALTSPAPSPTSCPPLHFRALPGVSAGPGLSSAAPPDRNKKTSSSSITSLGLKKFFLALGQGTRPRLGKSHSYSVEQLQPPAPGSASHSSTPKVQRAPSLQSLRLVSPKGPANGCVRPVVVQPPLQWTVKGEMKCQGGCQGGQAGEGEAPVSPGDP